MTDTEKLREKIKLYSTGACIYQDGSYPCPINFETSDKVCLNCLLKWMSKEAGLKFVPHLRMPLVDDYERNEENAYNTPNEIYQLGQARMLGKMLAISSQIKDIEI